MPIIDRYNQHWLRTEYNQAIAAAQSGERWNKFERKKKEMPYLRYQCIMDGNTRPEHADLDGIIKRIDDSFWDKYMPPNGWGCRCEAIQLPGSDYEETPNEQIKYPTVPEMFQVNFGKQSVGFPQGHAYFKQLPRDFKREAKEMAREEVRRVIANAKQYKTLKNNPDYTEVRFDNYTGGVSAIHKEHNFEKQVGKFGIPRGDYERHATDALRKEGHSVILRSEIGAEKIKQPDGFLDGVLMDIKGVEGNCLYAMNRANRQKVNTAILYYHKVEEFSFDVVKEQWNYLPAWINQNTSIPDKTIHLKKVICVVNEKSNYKIYEIKNSE